MVLDKLLVPWATAARGNGGAGEVGGSFCFSSLLPPFSCLDVLLFGWYLISYLFPGPTKEIFCPCRGQLSVGVNGLIIATKRVEDVDGCGVGQRTSRGESYNKFPPTIEILCIKQIKRS